MPSLQRFCFAQLACVFVQVHDEGFVPRFDCGVADVALTYALTPAKVVDSWRIPCGRGQFVELPAMLGL